MNILHNEIGRATLNLPSFLWLWKIAAWSMGLSLFAYTLLAVSGFWLWRQRQAKQPRPPWLRPGHYLIGTILVCLVFLLLIIGLIGTIGHYGNLGHSLHLVAGISVVILVLISAISATQINPKRPWMRSLHVGTNFVLLLAFIYVTWTGWGVVQKYLP